MRRGRTTVVALTVLWLSACGSIPVGTMWKMYRMGPEGLTDANVAEVRAAVLSERWFIDSPNFDQGRLALELTRADETAESFAFTLEDVSAREQFQLDPPGPGQRWRIYAIEADEREAFQVMQRQLAGWLETGEFKGGSMTLAVDFDGAMDEASALVSESEARDADFDSHPDEVRFRVDLKLQQEQGYFPLVREYSMPITSDEDEG